MGIKCFMVSPEDIGWSCIGDERNLANPWEFGPGAMWWDRYPANDRDYADEEFAPYRRQRALYVALPPFGQPFCIDGPSTHFDQATRRITYGEGWQRTGEPPNVSVTPSINAVGGWHGHLTNGELV